MGTPNAEFPHDHTNHTALPAPQWLVQLEEAWECPQEAADVVGRALGTPLWLLESSPTFPKQELLPIIPPSR